MCDLFKGGTGTTTQSTTQNVNNTSNTQPAAFQMPALMTGLNAAGSLYGSSPGFTPLAYQSLPDATRNALSTINGYATGSGFGSASALTNSGTGALTALPSAQGAATGVLNNSQSDPTQANIADAGAYAANPYTTGMIKSAITPIERQLNEVAIPGLNFGASSTGNSDSSRAAQTEAILRRGAGESEANVASGILGSQYNSGLNLAENSRAANMNAGLGAAGALTSIGNSGANDISAGNGLALNDLGVPISTGQLVQGDMNQGNQVNYANAQNGAQFPWSMLNNYWNIAGRPLGSTSTTTGTTTGNSNGTQTTPGPGTLGGLLGLATGIGSFFAPTGLTGTGNSIAKNLFG